MPPEYAYFLADSWRMHPELCKAVSDLAYDFKLEAADAAALRHLEGAMAGVECVLVDHAGNSMASIEESREVAAQVNRHRGLRWFDGSDAVRPLEEKDILVVAAYTRRST